jgi:serine/threonine protein kinase
LIGKTVSHYKIISKLGEGGMGVVYKAEDTRLDRSVAIKFLPSSLATQDAAKKRFIHEAKAASSLEHPNICTVHDIGETDDGQMFIAMPHYEGETLQERIARGALDFGEAIDIVVQLASGLAKAHEQGIVHRDIKPGNIFITTDGHVKILDFGLAKLATETRLTKTGTTLGTIAYMSPEQASGGDVDPRSDIFSLGAVFYELLTGELPFKGDHEAAIIYGIMHNDPEPLQTHRGDIPEGAQQVIEKTLAKDVGDRYQSTVEFKDALAQLGFHTGSTGMAPTRGVSRSLFRRALPWIVVVGVLVAAAFLLRSAMSPSTDRSEAVSPTYTQLTFDGSAEDAHISPDGQFVVYTRDADPKKELVVQDVGGGEPIVLLDSLLGVWDIRWSNDSSKLAVAGRRTTESHTYLMTRLGGAIRRFEAYGIIDWSPDGRRIAVSGVVGKIRFIDVATGDVLQDSVRLDMPFKWLLDFDWSPSGEYFLVRVHQEDGSDAIWAVQVEGAGGAKRLAEGRDLVGPRWSPLGASFYYAFPTGAVKSLWGIGFDQRSGEVTDGPVSVLNGLAGLSWISSSSNGTLAYDRHLVDKDLWRLSPGETGEAVPTRLTKGSALDDWPSISPDGRQIAFVRVTGEVSNVFTMSIEGGSARQLTFMDSDCYFPAWSPDGREIAFSSYKNRKCQVWKVPVNGGVAEVFENSQTDRTRKLAWAPGKDILYVHVDDRNLVVLDPDTGNESQLLQIGDTGVVGVEAVVSPDGERVGIYLRRESGEKTGIWVISLVDFSQAFVLEGHKHPFGWSPDGQWIYYYDIPRPIGRVKADGSGEEIVFSLPFEKVGTHPVLSMSPDGKYVVGGFEVKTPSDIWLVENFDPDI